MWRVSKDINVFRSKWLQHHFLSMYPSIWKYVWFVFRIQLTCFWAILPSMNQTAPVLWGCRKTGSSSRSVDRYFRQCAAETSQRQCNPSIFSSQLPIVMLVAFSMCIVCLLMAGKFFTLGQSVLAGFSTCCQTLCALLTDYLVNMLRIIVFLCISIPKQTRAAVPIYLFTYLLTHPSFKKRE